MPRASRSKKDLRSLSEYPNTTFVIAPGVGADYWADELRKLRHSPAFTQLAVVDPRRGHYVVPATVQVQVYDGGNAMLKGKATKSNEKYPGVDNPDSPGAKAYRALVTELTYWAGAVYGTPAGARRFGFHDEQGERHDEQVRIVRGWMEHADIPCYFPRIW